MADKNFKVKSGLNIPITSAAILTTDSNGNISSTAILPITNGGTGQTSANNALNALLPIQNGGTINYTIQSDGTNVSWAKLYNQLIQNAGTSVTPRRNINIIGGTFADDAGTDTTTITFTDNVGVSKSGGDIITSSLASTIPLRIKGAASQTADLQQWHNSAGSVLSLVDSAGFINGIGYRQIGGNSNAFGTTTTAGTVTSFGPGGNAAIISIVVKGAASQTADLQQWHNSAGTVLANVAPDGSITAPAFKSAGTAVSSNITLVSGYKYFVNTTAARTLTLPASPSLGDEIVIYDASNSALTNNITVLPNGNKIAGVIDSLIIDANAAVAYLAYTGSTYGWAVN